VVEEKEKGYIGLDTKPMPGVDVIGDIKALLLRIKLL